MKFRKLSEWFSPSVTPENETPKSTAELLAEAEHRDAQAVAELAAAEVRSKEARAQLAKERTAESMEAFEQSLAEVARLRTMREIVLVDDLEPARRNHAAAEREKVTAQFFDVRTAIDDEAKESELLSAEIQAWRQVALARSKRVAEHQRKRSLILQARDLAAAIGAHFEVPYDFGVRVDVVVAGLTAVQTDSDAERSWLRYFAQVVPSSEPQRRIMPEFIRTPEPSAFNDDE